MRRTLEVDLHGLLIFLKGGDWRVLSKVPPDAKLIRLRKGSRPYLALLEIETSTDCPEPIPTPLATVLTPALPRT